MLWGRPPGTKQLCFSDAHMREGWLPCFQGHRCLPRRAFQALLKQRRWGDGAAGLRGPRGPRQHLGPSPKGFGLMGEVFAKGVFLS